MFVSFFSWSALATTDQASKVHLSKAETVMQAADICRSATEQRYGAGSIRFISEKVSWSKFSYKSLNGAMVKMRIRPAGKQLKNYLCLVKTDKQVKFFIR